MSIEQTLLQEIEESKRWSKPRILAEYRRHSKRIAEDDKRIKHLEEFAKKSGIKLE
jgi:hypothetical protein